VRARMGRASEQHLPTSPSTVAAERADDEVMPGGRITRVAVALVVVAGPSLPHGALATTVEGTPCYVFPSDNVWHMDVSGLPVHAKSRIWKGAMHAGSTRLHPDFGPPSYGIPYAVVGAKHGKVAVDFTYASESDRGPYPFGPGTPIEGGSDRHAIMLDRSDCVLYELYAARWNGGNPKAGAARSSTSRDPMRIGSGRRDGRAPMRRGSRSSPGCSGTTRCTRASSTTRSG
jgi:hypothetical protein